MNLARTAAKPTHAKALLDRVESVLVPLHMARMAELGADGSGLYAHYAARVGQGHLFTESDRERLSYVLNVLPAYDRYVVYRAGLGEFGFALALAGRHVALWEPNEYRRAAIEVGIQHLARSRRALRSNVVVAGGALESAKSDRAESSLGMAFALLLGGEPDQVGTTVRDVFQHTALLYAPHHFLRPGPVELEEATALLRKAGYRSFDQAAPSGLVLATREPIRPPRHSGKFSFLPNRRV